MPNAVAHAGHAHAAHHPALQHHFDTMSQQKEAAVLGMWVFLLTEILFFGGLFVAYMIYRVWYFDARVNGPILDERESTKAASTRPAATTRAPTRAARSRSCDMADDPMKPPPAQTHLFRRSGAHFVDTGEPGGT